MMRYVVLVTHYLDQRTYGIGFVDYDGRRPVLIASYADLSHRRSAVEDFVKRCNRAALDPAQLADVVENFVNSL